MQHRERAPSIVLEHRKNGKVVSVRNLRLKKRKDCEHEHGFREFTDKRGICWLKCPICGSKKKAPREKHIINWTWIPQKTLKNIIQVAEQVDYWKKFRPQTVKGILQNEKSAAWSYYAALITIRNITQQKKKQEMFIQPKTLRKLVTLFDKLSCEDLDWRDIRSTLKSSFGKCSRETAKIYHATMMHLNATIP